MKSCRRYKRTGANKLSLVTTGGANRSRGQSMIELVTATLLIVPAALCLLDFSVILLAVAENNFVCREVSRAVAAAPPNQAKTTAKETLKRVLASRNLSWCQISLTENSPEFSELSVPMADQGGVVQGVVTVKTESKVTPPFLLSATTAGKSYTCSAQQTFASTYVVPVEVPN